MRVMKVDLPLAITEVFARKTTTIGTGTVGCWGCSWQLPLPPTVNETATAFIEHRCEDYRPCPT